MIAVLVSGTGRSLLNLIEQGFKDQISYVGSNKSDCGGIQIAKEHGIPTWTWKYMPPADFLFAGGEILDWNGKVSGLYKPVDLIVLAGYTVKFNFLDQFKEKIINIHPSLLPSFGGKGMYGEHVHKKVLSSGVKFSGCTVHYVNNNYDDGPIILQRTVPISDNDTSESLAKKVFEEEKIALPLAINMHLQGKLKVDGNRVLWSE